MLPDPKWLELLKASGWQTLALAVGTGIFLYLVHLQVLPPLQDGWKQFIALVCLVSSMLTLATIISASVKFFGVRARFIAFWRERAETKALIEYVPHMRLTERQILGYLLAHNQQMFEGAMDGGHASTLISRGIIVRALRPGQAFTADKVPYVIQNHHWKVLQRPTYKQQFIDQVDPDSPYPWRVNWMERY